MDKVIIYKGELFKYGFPDHIFNTKRFEIFWSKLVSSSILTNKNIIIRDSQAVDLKILELFHDKSHIEYVRRLSESGNGFLDYGDTPVFKGLFEIALHVVGATVDATNSVLNNEAKYAFNPAGGYHHAKRNASAGFCVFNDVGVAIEYMLKKDLVDKIYYIDIDAHHGDGVYYSFEDNPNVYIFDVHESGRFIYPGTGFERERGRGKAVGTKINVSLLPGASDNELIKAIDRAYKFGLSIDPDIIILQAGADGISGDPITHLNYSLEGYKTAIKKVKELANNTCEKLVVLGGGGYNVSNVSEAWFNILKILLDF